jgi:DNA invertase Pin-like site-specific DNA recombinase
MSLIARRNGCAADQSPQDLAAKGVQPHARRDEHAGKLSVVRMASKAALAQRMQASGEPASTIAAALGVSRATIHRALSSAPAGFSR